MSPIPSPSSPQSQDTRDRLIQAAGQVIAEKGYAASTGREICDLAETNLAAINYHFGGKYNLYLETLRAAHRELVTVEALSSDGGPVGPPEKRLEEIIRVVLSRLLSRDPESWPAKLIVREMQIGSEALEYLVDEEIRPKSMILRRAVADIMELPVDHALVDRGSVSLIGQCLILMQDRPVIKQLFPRLDFSPDGVEAFVEHVTAFTIGGLRALAEHARPGWEEA